MSAGSAFAALSFTYQERMSAAREQHRAGVPVIGFTSNTVPWELIRASGAFPVLVSPSLLAAPAEINRWMGQWMEPSFPGRVRAVFSSMMSGDWSFLKLLIIPRTSEPEYKLYLYLREMVRQGEGPAVPPVYLYDLLHTRSARSRKYGHQRTVELQQYIEQVASPITTETFLTAVHEANAARSAIRRLLKLRGPTKTKLTGVEAMTAIGASYFTDRRRFAEIAEQLAGEVAMRPALAGPKLLVAGFPLDHPNLHALLESHGAVVVAEDDWWGSRAAGRNVRSDLDPATACFEKYYLDAPSPRVYPPAVADRWFERTAQKNIDGVIFYHPPDDDVYGWDYPRHRDFLNLRGIPNLRIREDCAREIVPESLHQEIATFFKNCSSKANKK